MTWIGRVALIRKMRKARIIEVKKHLGNTGVDETIVPE
jgi:hypothetical protein